jgi:hypothetical protein
MSASTTDGGRKSLVRAGSLRRRVSEWKRLLRKGEQMVKNGEMSGEDYSDMKELLDKKIAQVM